MKGQNCKLHFLPPPLNNPVKSCICFFLGGLIVISDVDLHKLCICAWFWKVKLFANNFTMFYRMVPVSLERVWKCNSGGVGANLLHLFMEGAMSSSPKYICFISIFEKEKERCQAFLAGGGLIAISDVDTKKLCILAWVWKSRAVSQQFHHVLPRSL